MTNQFDSCAAKHMNFTTQTLDKLKQDQESIFVVYLTIQKHIDEPERNLKRKRKKSASVQPVNKLHTIIKK